MKHLGKVSVVRDWTTGDLMRDRSGAELGFADAKTDYKDAVLRATQDFILQKKNEIPL